MCRFRNSSVIMSIDSILYSNILFMEYQRWVRRKKSRESLIIYCRHEAWETEEINWRKEQGRRVKERNWLRTIWSRPQAVFSFSLHSLWLQTLARCCRQFQFQVSKFILEEKGTVELNSRGDWRQLWQEELLHTRCQNSESNKIKMAKSLTSTHNGISFLLWWCT